MILEGREQKRRLLLRLKGIETGQALIGPSIVHFHLTDLCNLRCQYCWHYGPDNAHKPDGKDHLPMDVFEKVIHDCAQLQVDDIYLSGIGDPMLHPRFYDILKLLENSFTTTIYSNATFPLERCRDILRADRIIINLGAPDREHYRVLQGRDLFLRVIKNIRELARLRDRLKPDFRIEVVMVVTRLNEKGLSATESLVRKLGADSVDKKVFQPSDHNRHIMPSGQPLAEKVSGPWPACYHGWFYSAIQLNGDVNVCTFMQRVNLGNVFTGSFKDIWASPGYVRARLAALTGDPFKHYHECINCPAARRNQKISAQWETYHQLLKV